MKELIKRAKILVVLMFSITTVVMYFGVLKPMEIGLYESKTESYVNLSVSKFQTVENAVFRCVEGGDSLSSRTMILNMIVDYNSGQISFEELRDYTQPKYEDGAKVLEYLVAAVRIQGSKEIARYDNEDYSVNLEDMVDLAALENSLHFIKSDNEIYLSVISEVKSNDDVIAEDVLLFSISNVLEYMSDEDIKAEILYADEYRDLFDQAELIEKNNSVEVFKSDDYIYATLPLSEEVYVSIETQNDFLYSDINQVIYQVIITWVLLIIILFLILYFFFFRFVRTRFMVAEKSMHDLQNKLNKDKLTNAYSRSFLDIWNNNIRIESQLYSLVMLDIDDFKKVNDDYGHLVGDQVLKEVAKAIMDSIRSDDFLIRYGGDEFLILFNDLRKEDADGITLKVLEKVKNIDKFKFKVFFSYGISELYLYDDLNDAIKFADINMYMNKKVVKS